jgi:putative copper export protein
VLFTLGGLTEERNTGIPTVPWATLMALPLDIWIRDLATALTLGALVIGLVLAPQPSRVLGRLASISALVWVVALVSQSVLTVSEVLALPLASSLDATKVWSLVAQTDLGRVMLVQVLMVAVIAASAWATRARLGGWTLAVLGVVAAWLPGLTGHSGLDDGHVAASIGLGLHLVFASLWVGGLIATAIFAASGEPGAATVLRRFSVLALVSVIVIAETGLLNAALRLDGVAALVTSTYGTIILAKVTILIVLIGWGWRHRRAVAQQWDTHPVVVRWVAWEVLWMGAVYGLSVALSRTAPPGVALPGDRLTAGSFTVIVLGLPLAVGFVNARALRAPHLIRQYPEVAAVLTLVMMVIVGVGVPSPLAGATVGVQVASLIGAGLLVVVGWLLVTVLRAGSALPATMVAMVGWPIVIWWLERDAPGGLSIGMWVTVLLAEGLIAWLSFGPRSATGSVPRAEEQPQPVEVTTS